MTRAALGSLVFFLVAPGTVVGVIPWLITRWEDPGTNPLGWALVVLGVGFLVHAFAHFVAALGTPAPIAPTEHLVVSGIYRHVRNPMYVAIFSAITGQAIVFGSWFVFAYGVAVLVVQAAFVKVYEEPTLHRQFGQEYADYTANVPGWLPRVRPWVSR